MKVSRLLNQVEEDIMKMTTKATVKNGRNSTKNKIGKLADVLATEKSNKLVERNS